MHNNALHPIPGTLRAPSRLSAVVQATAGGVRCAKGNESGRACSMWGGGNWVSGLPGKGSKFVCCYS